jgi:hypothetical protein
MCWRTPAAKNGGRSTAHLIGEADFSLEDVGHRDYISGTCAAISVVGKIVTDDDVDFFSRLENSRACGASCSRMHLQVGERWVWTMRS